MPEVTNVPSGKVSYETRPYGGSVWTPKEVLFYTSSSNDSISHRLPLDTERDVGGPWILKRSRVTAFPATYVYPGFGFQTFKGQYCVGGPVGGGDFYPDPVEPTQSQLWQAGTKAMNSVNPVTPEFDGATFLGEAKEGLPSMLGLEAWRNKTNVARSAGSEYLNVEFGWKPLIADLRKFGRAVMHSNDILNQYHKGSGKKQKRAMHFPSESATNQISTNFVPIPSDLGGFLTGAQFESKTSDVWFEGCFKYFIPSDDGLTGRFQRYASDAQKLFGLKPTPEVVWNLSPWSWAADWFFDVGTLATSVSNMGTDGVYLQYGYVMSHLRHEVVRTAGQAGTKSYTYWRREYDIKKRLPATPFGFGTDLTALGARQTAILAALAASKA